MRTSVGALREETSPQDGRWGRSITDYTSERLAALCRAAGFNDQVRDVVVTYRRLLEPWGSRLVGRSPDWVSDISDDNTPVEFSATLANGCAEVRVLFEPQAEDASVEAHRAAGIAMNERLANEFGADLTRFRMLQDLFLPRGMKGPFAVWSSAVFAPGSPPAFKAYFNPQAQGPENAEGLVKEALARLGLPNAWSALAQSAARRGPILDELKYFALDLTGDPHARIKVYLRHHAAAPDDLETAASAAESYVPGEAVEFVRAMRGGDERLNVRAPFTCSSFIGERAERPVATTLYVPICAYARHDAEAKERVRHYMEEKGIDPRQYCALVDGFAHRPLDAGVGMQSWIALRRYRGVARLTVYLGTEANRVYEPGQVPAPTEDLSGFLRRAPTPENENAGLSVELSGVALAPSEKR